MRSFADGGIVPGGTRVILGECCIGCVLPKSLAQKLDAIAIDLGGGVGKVSVHINVRNVDAVVDRRVLAAVIGKLRVAR